MYRGSAVREETHTAHQLLELMIGALAVRTKHKGNMHVQLLMDNQTAPF